jgi:hypothetical protein
MPRFLIESPHTGRECLMVLKDFLATGYLTHFEWGCKQGEHFGWCILEAASAAEAKMAVPSLVRDKARIVELKSFTQEDIAREEALHKNG